MSAGSTGTTDRKPFLPLAAPHTAIGVKVDTHFWGYLVEYQGPSLEALVAAGCITPQMAACMSVRQFGGRQRRDEEGDSYRMRKLPSKREPGRVQVGRYIDAEERSESGVLKALALPGVRECVAADGSELHVSASTEPQGMQHRERFVGRWQRQVRWFQIENVIWPDWREVRSGFSKGMMRGSG